jgi:hypothetical protein
MAQLLRCNPVESDALCGSENAELQAILVAIFKAPGTWSITSENWPAGTTILGSTCFMLPGPAVTTTRITPERKVPPERHIEHKQVRQQESWFDRTRDKIEPQLASEKSRLMAANVPASEIETHIILLNQREDLVEEIVKAARDNDCGTIVVGRTSYPWIKEQFHTHINEQLVS